MKNNIPCSLIRDLLPSYMENLTEDETNTFIKEHLETCDSCKKLYESMKEPDTAETEDKSEVDYLKKVKKKSRRKIILSVALTCLIFLCLAAAKVFVIGTNVTDKPLEVCLNDVGNLEVTVFNPSSATVFTGFKTNRDGSKVNITMREALVSPIYKVGHAKTEVALDGIDEVTIFGKIIWQNNKVISDFANILYQNKTPYIGSMHDVLRLASNLKWPQKDMENRLYTSEEPYGWELVYQKELSENNIKTIEKNAPVMIALVENMGEVLYSFPTDEGKTEKGKITEKEINRKLPKLIKEYNKNRAEPVDINLNIKDFASSPFMVQTLLEILDI